MKTIKNTGIFIFFLFSGMMLTAQERHTLPVTLEKVTEHVYQIKGGSGSNGGVIVGETGILVIDSKMDEESVKQSIEAIHRVTVKPIKFLVNTHSDGDHIMGNRYYPNTITFVAHENCREDFFKENHGRASDWEETEYSPFIPSVTFHENLNLWLGKDRVELHYFGIGHTTGDIVVHYPEDKIAFLGDLYFSDRPQLIHSIKNGNSFEYVKTMKNMLETLDADTFLSGHSDPVGRGEIERHIREMVERQNKVKELIGQDKPLEEILAEFQDNESRLVTSIYNEINGQQSGMSKSEIESQNLEVVRRWIEEVNVDNFEDLYEALFSKEFKHHVPSNAEAASYEDYKETGQHIYPAFHRLSHRIEDIIAEGNKVIVRMTARAIHGGDFYGIPPTGNKLEWSAIAIFKLAEGKIIERWEEVNLLGLFQQIGMELQMKETAE